MEDSTDLEPHQNEIYPGLWLGDAQSSMDTAFLRRSKISCVLNCTASLPFTQLKTVRYRYRVPVKDNLEPDQIYLLYTLLDKTSKIIYSHLRVGQNILVHCHAGRQRSVSVIVAFCMKCADMTKSEALECVQTKRVVAGMPQLNFDRALTEYEKSIRELKASLGAPAPPLRVN